MELQPLPLLPENQGMNSLLLLLILEKNIQNNSLFQQFFFFYVGVNFVKVWINKLQWWQIMVILHISGKLVHWKVLIFVGVQKWLPKSKSAFKTSGFHFLMIKLQYQKQTQKKINYNEWWMDTDPFTQGKKFSNKSQREEVVILTLRQTVQRPTST